MMMFIVQEIQSTGKSLLPFPLPTFLAGPEI